MSVYPNLIYEKDFENSLCYFDTIGLIEYDNSINNINYIYSGITLIFNLTGFTSHFDTTGHTYSNIILNNDVYTYTGITGETHYFQILNFYSGATPTIDPLLYPLTEDEVITGFTTSIISCVDQLAYSGNCCPVQAVMSNLPWVCITNTGAGIDNCSDYIARRTEEGWTLDYVFNKNGQTGWTDTIFFYTGVRDEYDPANYIDNNLSFGFTSDGRIKWSSYRYSGYCDTVSGYTPIYYVSTGQTFPLCTGGTSNDFNITISFERYFPYSGCDLANKGGWNDLIPYGVTYAIDTGITTTDGDAIAISGETALSGMTIEVLNDKWLNEGYKRLGTLKLYLNGKPLQIDVPLSPIPNFRNLPVYKVDDFEEIVLFLVGDFDLLRMSKAVE